MLMASCTTRIVDSADAPIVNANGGSPSTPSTAATGGRLDQVVGSASGGTTPRYPRPVAIDGSAGNQGTPSGSDAGVRVPVSDGGVVVAPPLCTVSGLPSIPGAGTGELSRCAPKTCTGIPAGTDISEYWHDDFPASTYAGCTSVTGSIVVAMTTNVDLGDLACLEHVGGNLLVWNNPGLTTLHGLESLRVVEGSLTIGRFGSLSAQNENLHDVAALGMVEVVGKDLILDFALPLPDLDGFGSLVAVGGNLAFHSSAFQPTPAPSPKDVSGFGSLATVGGNLLFEAVDDLARTTGFGSLTTIGGSVVVNGATNLTSLGGFPRLSCIGKNFSVIVSYLEENTALESIGPFPSLQLVGGSVHIEGTPNLESIELFDHIGRLDGGTLRILSNPKLATMPVSALGWVGDDVVFGDNPSLPVCPLFDLRTRLESAGYAHHFTVTGGLVCPAGMTCLATSCVVP